MTCLVTHRPVVHRPPAISGVPQSLFCQDAIGSDHEVFDFACGAKVDSSSGTPLSMLPHRCAVMLLHHPQHVDSAGGAAQLCLVPYIEVVMSRSKFDLSGCVTQLGVSCGS